jgi:hypothetical protein
MVTASRVPFVAAMTALVFMPAVPGGVIIIMAVGVVGVAGISIISQPDGVTGFIIITGIIKPCGIVTRVIITVITLVIIISSRHSFTGKAPVEAVVPSLLVNIIRVEAVRVFFKEKGAVA